MLWIHARIVHIKWSVVGAAASDGSLALLSDLLIARARCVRCTDC